jgi:NADH-quinone oxidoreductase subunit N
LHTCSDRWGQWDEVDEHATPHEAFMNQLVTTAGGAQWSNIGSLAPELILVAAASLLIVLDLVFERKRIVALAGVVGCLAALIAAAWLFASGASATVFNGMFVVDGYGGFFKLFFYLVCILTICMSVKYLEVEGVTFGEYYAVLLLATAGMAVMVSAADLIVLFLGLELMTLSTYILIGIKRESHRSNEAAIKYFLLGGFSTAFLLYGIALLYGLTGTTQIDAIAAAVTAGVGGGGVMVLLPVVFVVVGFGFKISAAPFHMWAPDVYEGAPTPVTAFLSVGSKIAAFAALGRTLAVAFKPAPELWSTLLMVLAVLSMGVGSILALTQTNIKRMLAYSSIAHAGYALLGLIAGGAEGLTAMMVYLFIYGLMNLGAFSIVIALTSEGAAGEDLESFGGLAKIHPRTSALMLVFMFSLVGIPPTAGFVAKFSVFMAVIRAGYTPLALIGVVFSVVSAFFYLRVVVLMYMKDPTSDRPLTTSMPLQLALAVTAAAIIVLGVYPAPLLDLATAAMAGWEPSSVLLTAVLP